MHLGVVERERREVGAIDRVRGGWLDLGRAPVLCFEHLIQGLGIRAQGSVCGRWLDLGRAPLLCLKNLGWSLGSRAQGSEELGLRVRGLEP